MLWIYGFWFLAGVLCGAGALLLLLPAWRRHADAPGGAALPRWGLLGGAAGILVVVGLYMWLGRPDLIGSNATTPAAPHATGAATATGAAGAPNSSAGSMDAAVSRLEARLAQGNATDADWDLLAKSYEFLGRTADAASARAKHLPAGAAAAAPRVGVKPLDAAATKLVAQARAAQQQHQYKQAREIYAGLAARGAMNADTWADYADVSASDNGGKLAGEPEQFIAQALALDPQHAKALWLQASMQHETARYTDAVASWQRLAARIDPASADAKLIAANIEEDRRLGGLSTAAPAGTASAAAGAVSGDVVLADSVKSRAASGLTLFIIAKSVDQPGMPVAVLRTATGRWPFQFKLDDSLSMMPTRPLSGAGRITIEARISRSGQAMPAAGDLQGSSGVVDPRSSRPVRIVIDHAVN